MVLEYPRSGSSSVVAVRPIDLPSGAAADTGGDPDDFLATGVFKEIVQGETALQIRVTDRDKRNRFLLFVRRVLTALFGVVTKGAISNISEVVVSATAGEIAKDIGALIKGRKKEKIEIIGQTARAKLVVSRDGSLVVTNAKDKGVEFDGVDLRLQLLTPSDLVVSYKKLPGGGVKVDKRIPKGAANGEIVLRLASEPI